MADVSAALRKASAGAAGPRGRPGGHWVATPGLWVMSPADELALLEAAYAKVLADGVASYGIAGRNLTPVDIRWMTERVDALRFAVARQQTGGGMFRRENLGRH